MFTDTDVKRGQTYCYQVQAYNIGNAVSAKRRRTRRDVSRNDIALKQQRHGVIPCLCFVLRQSFTSDIETI